ncbi:MAG: ribbon-helix-helix protein, CopG family [Thermoanaerobaculia bacterium]
MATTVHLPRDLLDAVDKQAGELGLSRNRYIILALERAIEKETGWSPDFLEELAAAAEDVGAREMIEEMMKAITTQRTRKPQPEL